MEDAGFGDAFRGSANKAPNLALGAGVWRGDAEPHLFVSGTIYRSGPPVALDAPWHIGSISKSFTATLILQLVEAGVLNLDAPIESYLPDHRSAMHADWRALTLRALLSHTGAVPPNPSRMRVNATRIEVLSEIWNTALAAVPFQYSNVGFVLAGFVAETATGQSWESMIKARIAEPLGLSSLGYGAPLEAPWGHRNVFGFYRGVDPAKPGADNPVWMGPAGRIHLNLRDLLQWARAHLLARRGEMPEFLSAESCAQMQTAVDETYALGWVVEPSDAGPYVWHNGSNTMWYGKIAMLPSSDGVVAVVRNHPDPRPVDHLVEQFRNLILR